MATKVTMPKLGLTMTEGTIIEWKKKEGEPVEKGEIIYLLETEKVTFEVEAPESGILGKIIAKEGDVVPVGGIVAYILQPGEELAGIPEAAEVEARVGEVEVPTEAMKPAVEKATMPQGVRISPLARRIAEEHNIDISTVKGTGPEGRIVKDDVLRAVEEGKVAVAATRPAAEEELPEEKVVPLSSMRKTIARRMVESFQSTPHFYTTMEVDTKELERVRQQLIPSVEERVGVRLTITDLLVKIVARALEEHPYVNSSFAGDSIKLFSRIDIGLATSVDEGLIVPVIRRVNKLTLPEIAKTRADLVAKTRERKVTIDQISGGTFTITNLGMFDIVEGGAIINPPEAAILMVGSIIDKPVAMDGEIVIRPRMNLTLSIDHRVLDGVAAARFLQSVKEIIEIPSLMLL